MYKSLKLTCQIFNIFLVQPLIQTATKPPKCLESRTTTRLTWPTGTYFNNTNINWKILNLKFISRISPKNRVKILPISFFNSIKKGLVSRASTWTRATTTLSRTSTPLPFSTTLNNKLKLPKACLRKRYFSVRVDLTVILNIFLVWDVSSYILRF